MLKQKTINELPDGITWVNAGESVPMMQGMALNKLKGIYKSAKKMGWVLYEDDDDGGICLYILDGLKAHHKDGSVRICAVAFKENGDSIEGYAIYWRDEDKPESGKQYALTGTTGSSCIMNGNNWVESEVKE